MRRRGDEDEAEEGTYKVRARLLCVWCAVRSLLPLPRSARRGAAEAQCCRRADAGRHAAAGAAAARDATATSHSGPLHTRAPLTSLRLLCAAATRRVLHAAAVLACARPLA